jgi:hypothetical protein
MSSKSRMHPAAIKVQAIDNELRAQAWKCEVVRRGRFTGPLSAWLRDARKRITRANRGVVKLPKATIWGDK